MVLSKSARSEQIIDYLRDSRDPVAASELARLMDCSERTVHWYVDELRSQSVVIESVLGPGGGLVLGPSRESSDDPPKQSISQKHESASRAPFVGRTPESESLDQALDRALAGKGGIVAAGR